MTILPAFLLVALGIVLHAAHGYVCRRAAELAYRNGYQQAAKEEQIRLTTEDKVKKLALPAYPRMQGYAPRADQVAEMPKKAHEAATFPQSFVDDFNNNGRAACRLR